MVMNYRGTRSILQLTKAFPGNRLVLSQLVVPSVSNLTKSCVAQTPALIPICNMR